VIAATADAHAQSVTLISPTPTTRVRDVVELTAHVQVTAPVTTATMTVEGYTADLEWIDTCGAGCQIWTGELAIGATPILEGTKTVDVFIEDNAGGTAATSGPFIFDRPAVTTVAMPTGTVARPTIQVTGTCDDSTGAPCPRVDFFLGGMTVPSGAAITRTLMNVTAFDEEFDLTTLDGHFLQLTVRGHDPYPGGTHESWRDVHVDLDPALLPMVDVEHVIGDVDLRRVVHCGANGVGLYDRATMIDQPLGAQYSQHCALTPDGAAWDEGLYPSDTAILSAGGMFVHPDGGVPQVAGSFVVYQDAPLSEVLHLRNVETGTDVTLTDAVVGLPGANGAVIYIHPSTDMTVFRDPAGIETELGTNRYPYATDGVLVVAGRAGCVLDLYDASGLVENLHPGPCGTTLTRAMVRHGWVVWFRGTSLPTPPYVEYALWARAPTGERHELATGLRSPWFDDVSPTGEVFYSNKADSFTKGAHYRVAPGVAPVEVWSNQGFAMWRDGYWMVRMGRSLFALDVIPPVDPTAPDGLPPDAAPAPDAAGNPANPDAGGGMDPGGGGCGCASNSGASPLLTLAVLLLLLRRRAPA
jgi:uncharacterized protein (TIGR03382 family)